MTDHRNKILLLILISLAAIAAAFLFDRIPQNPGYHLFADTRNMFGVPNFWNVVSNVPFLLVGLAGVAALKIQKLKGAFPLLKTGYFFFFLGILFTGFGSAYYHLNPDNSTLLWDRLPMTIAFMAFFSVITGEFVSFGFAKKGFWPLLLTGAASVFYWHFTESHNRGDLRFYALVQFLPMILIPLILLLFKRKTDTNLYTWLVILAYLAAKFFETFDQQLLNELHVISGHTVKHLAAALAPLFFLIGLYKRKIIS